MKICKFCEGTFGKDIDIRKSPESKETQPNKAQIVQHENDTAGIVLFRNGLAQGFFDINYCPICGRKLGDIDG